MFTNLKNQRSVAMSLIVIAIINIAFTNLAIAQQQPTVPNPSNTEWIPIDPPLDYDFWWWQGSSQRGAYGTICFSAPGGSIACNNPASTSITITQGTQLTGGLSIAGVSIGVGKTFQTQQKFPFNGKPCKICELFLCYSNALLFEYVSISNITGNNWVSYSLQTGNATPAGNVRCTDARAWCCSSGENPECCDDETECDGGGEGDCLLPNGTPGCEDAECCSSVCPIDPMCCQIEWDELCALIAGDLCYPSDQSFKEESTTTLIIDLASSNQDEPNLLLWNLTEQQQCELEQVITMQIIAAPHGQYEELFIFDADQTVYYFDLLGDFQLFGHIDRDNFDSYFSDTELHGENGWKGWDNDPAFSAPVSNAQAYSEVHSVKIADDADLVHEFCDITTGKWSFSAWQYIPFDFQSGGNGQLAGSYFILCNTYEDGGPYNWSVQMQFDGNDDMLKVFHGNGLNTIEIPYIVEQWVKIEAIINLDNDWTQIYYDDQLIAEYSWTGGALGEGGGALDIAAVDLFAKGSSSIFYDDILLEPYQEPAPPCPADLNNDGTIGTSDLILLFAAWGTNPVGPPDLDGDGVVSTSDLLVLFNQWGPCP
ncbi:MAG: hypothetical protein IH984_15780 [Planctomycetes bacterium]|nr:hypothetical protein [Planctomycetota bacterium]